MTTTLAPTTAATDVPRRIGVRFIAGMPGLEQYTHFTLIGIDDSPGYWLQCDEQPEIALPVADAFGVVPNYSFNMSDADAHVLGLRDAADALVLVVLTAPRGGIITANLLAPVVVNRNSRVAKQVILDDARYSLRYPLASRRGGSRTAGEEVAA
jgi:flagellar assembly factor FliW